MNSLNATKIRQDFSMHVLLKKLNILPPHSHPDYRFPCPIHKGNNPTTCRINDYNKIYCFKCAKSYDVIDVYSTLHQTPFKTTLIRLNQFLQDPEYQELLQQKPSHNKQQPRSGHQSSHSSTSKRKTPSPINDDYTSFFTYVDDVIDFKSDEERVQLKYKYLSEKISPLFNHIRDYYHELLINNKDGESQKGLDYLLNTRQLKMEAIREFKLGYAPLSNKPLSFRFVNYMKQKKVPLRELLEYGLIKAKQDRSGKTYYHDAFHGSIIIPIQNAHRQTYHFYENNFEKTTYFQPKYKSLPNFIHEPTFYYSYRFFEALEQAKKTKILIIHEGFFDTISAWQNNILNATSVIVISQPLSEAQLKIIRENDIKVIITLDNDETGERRSLVLAEQLKNHQITYENRHILPPYNFDCKDVDDLLKKHGTPAYQKCFIK